MYYPYPVYYYYPTFPYGRFPVTQDPDDVELFKLSASQFIHPAQELQQLLNHIAHTPGFAKELKVAASQSHKDKVKSLIASAGIQSHFTVDYNPDGIGVTLQPADSKACFAIRMNLCW